MATHSHRQALVANTVATVTISAYASEVTIVNEIAADVFVRTDGTAAAVGADDNFVVPANSTAVVPNLGAPPNQAENIAASTAVSLISGTAGNVTVEI